MTPSHFDHAAVYGVGFLLVAWLQAGLAVRLLIEGWRDRVTSVLVAVTGAVVISTWAISRTVGLPGLEREGLGSADLTATGLSVVAVAGAVVSMRRYARRQVGLLQSATSLPARALRPAAAQAASALAVVLASAALLPAADVHGHDEAGDDDEIAHPIDHASHDDGSDHGSRVPAGDGWEDERRFALVGPVDHADRVRKEEAERAYLANQILQRSTTLPTLPPDEARARVDAFVDWTFDDRLSDTEVDSDAPPMHTHAPMEWQPLADPAQQLALQAELRLAATAIERVPTAADALAAGYVQTTPYNPGTAAHYLNPALALDDRFDPATPEILLFNGNSPDAELVGVTFASVSEEPPSGFTGGNDEWHNHPTNCMFGLFVIGPDHTPPALCESVGATNGSGVPFWLVHLWQVPGWESHWGLFSAENPAINFATVSADALD